MDHNHALDSHAVERYLLSEMSTEERDDFEDHYFSCSACAEDVRAASRFRDDVRIQLKTKPDRAPTAAETKARRWWTFPQLVPIGVAAALAGVVVYLAGVQIPEFKRQAAFPLAAQPLVSVGLHGITRGEADHIPPGGDVFGVYFDVPSSNSPTTYDYEVTAPNGRVAARITALAPKPGEPVNLLLPRVNFPRGTYTINVREGKLVVSQHNFIVE